MLTSCTKSVSLNDFAEDSGWESLSNTRRNHNLTFYCRMIKGLTLNSLRLFVTQGVDNISYTVSVVLEIIEILKIELNCAKSLSFPVIADWNELPIAIRNGDSSRHIVF